MVNIGNNQTNNCPSSIVTLNEKKKSSSMSFIHQIKEVTQWII